MRIPRVTIDIFGVKTTTVRLFLVVVLLILIGFTATNNWIELTVSVTLATILVGAKE